MYEKIKVEKSSDRVIGFAGLDDKISKSATLRIVRRIGF